MMSENDSARDEETGRFLPGNRFWEARSTHGAKPKFENPEDLWDACVQYFEWVAENPLLEEKGFAFQGNVTKENFTKMRAMTVGALCLFIDVSHETWITWRKERADLSEVIARVEQIIRAQKFEGAAADLLNPNIIARDLGLRDKIDADHTTDGEKMTTDASMTDIARSLAFILATATQDPDES